jgi:hypothetical protein
MTLSFQHLIYVAFYTAQIHFIFYYCNDPTDSIGLLCTSSFCITSPIHRDSKDDCRSQRESLATAIPMLNCSDFSQTSKILNSCPTSTMLVAQALQLSNRAPSSILLQWSALLNSNNTLTLVIVKIIIFLHFNPAYLLLDYYYAHHAQEGIAFPRPRREYAPHIKQVCFQSCSRHYLGNTSLSTASKLPSSRPSQELTITRTVSATVEFLPDSTALSCSSCGQILRRILCKALPPLLLHALSPELLPRDTLLLLVLVLLSPVSHYTNSSDCALQQVLCHEIWKWKQGCHSILVPILHSWRASTINSTDADVAQFAPLLQQIDAP